MPSYKIDNERILEFVQRLMQELFAWILDCVFKVWCKGLVWELRVYELRDRIEGSWVGFEAFGLKELWCQ